MRALLDVNVLIALLDSAHIHHLAATTWLKGNFSRGWASCPLTQNGCIRIMSQSRYPNVRPAADIASRLRDATNTSFHEFWPNDISILDDNAFDWRHVLSPRQITDTYLLALAVRNGGTFVTFDHAIPLKAVRGAAAEHLVRI